MDHPLNSDTCIFFYHGCDFSAPPARQQYLMSALSKHVPVIYFDGGGGERLSVTFSRPQPNLTVVRGLTAGYLRLRRRGLASAAGFYANWRLRHLRRRYRKIIFWCAENWLRPYRFIAHDALVYDCIDPCFSDDPVRIADFHSREKLILTDAKQAFATADSLAAFCRQYQPNVRLLNNACDPADYSQDLLDAAPAPSWWPRTDRPLAAYLGSLDWRFDFAAVERACARHPDIHFILAGNQLAALHDKIQRLAQLPNVTCPGRISVSDGRFLVNRCAVGLIPFTVGPMNDAINPVKMYMYALLGKPIAGTPVRELTSRPRIVVTGEDFSQSVSLALNAVGNPETVATLKQFAAANTWEDRAAQAWDVIKHL